MHKNDDNDLQIVFLFMIQVAGFFFFFVATFDCFFLFVNVALIVITNAYLH